MSIMYVIYIINGIKCLGQWLLFIISNVLFFLMCVYFSILCQCVAVSI